MSSEQLDPLRGQLAVLERDVADVAVVAGEVHRLLPEDHDAVPVLHPRRSKLMDDVLARPPDGLPFQIAKPDAPTVSP
jgi:hypothetical protein